MTDTGRFTIPCRLLLTGEQRDRLERLCRKREIELSELASEVLAHFIDDVPDSELAEPFERNERGRLEQRLRDYQRDLRRLRIRQNQLGAEAPHWLGSYMADVEAEIAKLQHRLQEFED